MNTVAVCRRQGENQGNVNIIPFVIYNAYRNKSDEITFLSFSHSLQAHVGAFYYKKYVRCRSLAQKNFC